MSLLIISEKDIILDGFLGTFNVMRNLGLGITNDNIRKISVGEVE